MTIVELSDEKARHRNAADRCVVVALDDHDVLPAPEPALDWLRSPARLSIAVLQGRIGPEAASAVLACDIVLMSRDALWSFGQPDSGQLPAPGATEVLATRLGPGRALLVALAAEPVDATRAWHLGLVDEVVEESELQHRVDLLVQAVLQRPPGWLAETKALLAFGSGPQHQSHGREQQRRLEQDAAARLTDEAHGVDS